MMTEKKLIVVTGGSRGIGRAIVLALAAEGYDVHFTYVSRPDAAEAVSEEAQGIGGQATAHRLDVADWDAVKNFFEGPIKDSGHPYGLVNNAAITGDGLLVRMKQTQWASVLDVGLGGAFACLQQAAKVMMRQRQGRIVNISSVVGQSGNAGQANYSAAKAGLIGLTKAAAQELAPRGVTVNALAPGFIETDMTGSLDDEVRSRYLAHIPLARFGRPEEIAAAVSYFLSPLAGYVTGQVLGLNGGLYM
ncbi:MAG: 3-oxoacyl-[acyl-carrier-protein] reductase [Deltaproteobacteria bacterium]|nr:3-oxoacyl-[acyl-carrier-protein] reductase [Deltaproteobacteria bacterium]